MGRYLKMAFDEDEAVSLLEYLSAQPDTVTAYRKILDGFFAWATDAKKSLREDVEVDAGLVEFMNARFLEGHQA